MNEIKNPYYMQQSRHDDGRMTREETIQVLTEINATLKSWSGFTKYPQAIDMAIEALQWQDRILTQIEDIVLKEHGEKTDK